MKTLNIFQAPNDGEVTLCEVDGRVHSMNYEYANISAFTTAVENYPKIHVTRDLLHTYNPTEERRDVFVPVDEPLLKRLLQVYYEQGFVEALQMVSDQGPVVVKETALIAIKIIKVLSTLRRKLNSSGYDDTIGQIVSISSTKNWSQSPIRCIAWHHYSTKIAVASLDDTVRIFSNDSYHVPLLKCKQQKNITCMAWRPLSHSDIAVGCENGIFIWNIDPTSLVTRPSINNAIILHRLNHRPVVSIAWSLRGDLLASAAACDSTILMWDVELDKTSSLKRPGCSGNVLLRWSPTGNKLFSATTGLIFRMWEAQSWQAERWNLLSGRVQAACWSPCGSVLLFTTTDEPIIYSLSVIQNGFIFAANSKNLPNQATPVYDLTRVDVDGLIVGGIVQNMEWDPKGDHIAVIFQDTNYVALFKVAVHPVLQLNPNCLVAGLPEEKPAAIAFQLNFEYGACLSIGWSSGRLQYFPIIYSEHPTSTSNRNLSKNSTFYGNSSLFRSPNVSYQ